MGRLERKVALITGGANGIGYACAERFAEEGAVVVIADLLDGPGEAAADTLRGAGHQASFVHLDAASASDNDAAVAAAVAAHGRLDISVTAAGVAYAGYTSGDRSGDAARLRAGGAIDQATMFLNLPAEQWQPVLDVNLTGTLLAVQSAGRQMAEQGSGAIVTIASIAALAPEVGALAYGVSKAGVWMVTKMAAMMLAPKGIRANAIGPGYIDTNMTKIIGDDPARAAKVLESVPMARFGRPREIADVALFLASDEASYVTGELLLADGGFFTH
jgi:NAD(P)-dependent dehydrogenase (short-subunit alcohol dehydrogenase family)